MKRKAINLLFLAILFLGIQIVLNEVWGLFRKEKPNVVVTSEGEHFDPSLSRLATVARFAKFCDSLYGKSLIEKSDSEQYATIVSRVLRERFYHGYSYYSLGDNSLGYIFAPLLKRDLRAIVIPDDILKHPHAACSQQSIVGMEIFKRKGFKVREVGFFSKGYGGHFCFEAFFNGGWHFFDPDMEPKLSIMVANHFPDIATLVKNDSLLHRLYYKNDKKYISQLFVTYTHGPVNKFPAQNARIFQYFTKYLSYSLWFWPILLYLFLRTRLRFVRRRERVGDFQGALA